MKVIHYLLATEKYPGRPSAFGRIRARTVTHTLCDYTLRGKTRAAEDWTKVTCKKCHARKGVA